ncbi:hypothetical protein P3102_11030 [Amycolatopsis sp. QT-25]|uniref:hypothetical protein n=1 Tax=Amycolatopsis sp. QT-25 TaxID=3034022 RepID=UPI0023EE01AE|nr:hypothetical protein [Amycolatopsis sp. QT-25]WET81695.1 hypothetical protein P3102_11030 [Amycolatopsis sp. QT-25]
MFLVDPAAHDFGGEPVSAPFSFFDDRDAVATPEWVGSVSEQERGGVDVERLACLDVVVVFDGVTGVEQVSKPGQVLEFDRLVS